MIKKVYIYHVLTDTDNTCLKFVFVSRSCADSVIPDKKFSKEKNEQFKFEQKSIATEAFNELQELKIKEKIEKRKQNSCELAEKKNKALQ